MDGMNIGELAEKVGIRTSAIRYYESEGLLPKPPRQSGWRRYNPSVVDRLQVIHAAREVGFSIEEIRTLLNSFPKETSPLQTLAETRQTKITRPRCDHPAYHGAQIFDRSGNRM